MNIGFDAKRAFQNFTGLGNYSRFIIDSLVKNIPEHQYFLYTTKKGIRNWELGIRNWEFEQKNLSDGRVKLETGATDTQTKFLTPNSQFLISLWRSWLINRDLQRDNIDIYHGLSNEIPFGIRKTKVKSVVTIHDLIFERYPELYPTIDRWIYKKKFMYACQNADAIVAVSEQTKRDIIDFYQIPKEKIVVIYQDCQEIFKQKVVSEKQKKLSKPYILCVASFSERKNQKRLIDAFRKLNLQEYELILVGGKSKYLVEIEKYLHEIGEKRVKIKTGIPNEELPFLYQTASLVVYPSIFEGFGIPIIEALHCGIPVVAASGSCIEEAGGNAALYANPLDVDDLADKMNLILSNENLRKQLVINGKEQVKKFSGEAISHQLNHLYKSL